MEKQELQFNRDGFLKELRRYRAYKREWQAKMDVKLAEVEKTLKQDREYLYYDVL